MLPFTFVTRKLKAIAHTRIQTPASVGVPPCPEQELQEQVRQLSVSDRLTLVSTIIQSLQDTAQDEDWQYLVTRRQGWGRQFYIKGHKLLALTVWQDMMANEMSPEQAAENWDLPLRAIYEVICYCESHRELLKLEADEERYRLEEEGISLEPTIIGELEALR